MQSKWRLLNGRPSIVATTTIAAIAKFHAQSAERYHNNNNKLRE